MEDKRIKRKMVNTDADAVHSQSMALLEINTMFLSTHTETDVITLEYQSENRLDFPTLARECDRYGISNRLDASFASAVLQDIGIAHEGKTSHVVYRNKIRRQFKKL
ncbi:hypothetical protein AVEN_154115-1 [Araneus ventricosus]|uniref:Uncharacterized protein n=1 Tax=Araneus ventricosus TaxID=182803 RepID=A0A4Y2V835_ARAVE|nr:hypothetical protein AVEN_124772-1 [Araneus ventricosus]GBO19852.1 hypothetical protein AVEN_154115-1 [Araneus ventricosus]